MKILQLPELGRLGRFGNWLHLYGIAKKYCETAGATLQTPSWPGQEIFEIDGSPITGTASQKLPWPLPETFDGIAEFNLQEYAIDTNYTDQDFQRYFQIRPQWRIDMEPVEVAVHIRAGDFLMAPNLWPIVVETAFCYALIENGFGPRGRNCHAVNWVSEENPRVSEWKGHPHPYIVDFQIMMKAKNLFVYPSSSFSGCAAKLNNNTVFVPHNYHNGETWCHWKKRE